VNSELIYLDHAAATPVDVRVIDAMIPYMTENFFNPSSPYAPAIAVRRDYEDAKHRLAMAIGGKADEIVMTAGATESINLMFGSIAGHVVTSTIEHHAVLAAARRHEHTLVEVGESGVIDPENIAAAITSETQLVSIALANNELGTIQPLRDIAEIIRKERRSRLEAGNTTPIYFHSDASQGVGQIDVNVARLGVDAITINASKVYGPKQIALLWTSREVHLTPQIVGGGQERGLRSGTENVAGTIGFALALELAAGHRKSESERLVKLRDTLQARLIEVFPDAVITGSQKRRLPGHLHISFPNVDAERVIFGLEARGVMVATGSACAANKGTRSHVLTAVGLSPEVADGSLRITLGRLTNEQSIERAAVIMVEVISHEISRSAA
jgi:cysteine desulfurase